MAVNEVGCATAAAAQRLIVNDQTAAGAVLAGLREDLEQTGAQALAGHLDQTQRGHLGHLVLGAVAAQALNQSAQHQVAVRLEHHVDEVNHDDAADIAQTQLTHNLLGRLQVVLGDGLFEVATATGELTGVHVHHGHGLGAVNHERAARGQVDLAIQRLSQLLVDAVVVEEVVLAVPLLQARNQVGCHIGHVGFDGVPGVLTLNNHRGEVLVEDVTHGLNHQVGLLVEHLGGQHLAGVGLLLNLFPLRAQAVNVVGQLLFGGALGRGAHNHAGTLGQLVLQNLLQARTLGVGQLAGNTGHGTARHVHQEAARQGNLAGQAGTLVTNRVLGDLHQHRITRLQGVLNLAGHAVQAGDVPVDLARVEHGVTAASNIDEGGLHRGQHVLHLAQVHVANQGVLLGLRHEVLGQHAVLEHTNLDAAILLTNQHLTVHGLAASQELGLGHDVAAAAQGTGLAATHALGLQTGGAAHTGHGVGCVGIGQARCTHLGDGLNVILDTALNLDVLGTAAAAATTVAGDLCLRGGLLAAALHAVLALLLFGGGAAGLTLKLGGHGELAQFLGLGGHEQRHRAHGGARAQLLQLLALQVAQGLNGFGGFLGCLFDGGDLGLKHLGHALGCGGLYVCGAGLGVLSLLLGGLLCLGLNLGFRGGFALNKFGFGGLFCGFFGLLRRGHLLDLGDLFDLCGLLDGLDLGHLLNLGDLFNLRHALLCDGSLRRLSLGGLLFGCREQAVQGRSNLGLGHRGSGGLRRGGVLSLGVTQIGQARGDGFVQGKLGSLLLLRTSRAATLGGSGLRFGALANILTQSFAGFCGGVLLLREGVQRLKNPKFDVLLVRH